MPAQCVAKGCRMGYTALSDKPVPPEVSFHKLPFSRPDLLEKWVENLKKDNSDYVVAKSHSVCSLHFAPEDFKSESTDKTGRVLRDEEGKRRTRRKSDIVEKDGVYKLVVEEDPGRRELNRKRLNDDAVPFEKLWQVARDVVQSVRDTETSSPNKRERLRPPKNEKGNSAESVIGTEMVVESEITGIEPEKDEDEEMEEEPPTRKSDRIERKKASIHQLHAGEYLLEELALPDELINFKDLEFRSEKHIPPEFSARKEKDSVLIFLIQDQPKTGVPMMRGCIRITEDLRYSVFLDGVAIGVNKKNTLDGCKGKGSVKRFSDLLKLTSAIDKYATGIHSAKAYFKNAECTLNYGLAQCDDTSEEMKKKVGFAAEQIRLAQLTPFLRRFDEHTMQFATWLHGIDRSLYHKLADEGHISLPSYDSVKRKLPAGPVKATKLGRITVDTPVGSFECSADDSSRSGRIITYDQLVTAVKESAEKSFATPPSGKRRRVSGGANGDAEEPKEESQTTESKVEKNDEMEQAEAVTLMANEELPAEEECKSTDSTVEERVRDPNSAVPFREGVQSISRDEAIEILTKPEDAWFAHSFTLDRPKAGDMFLLDVSKLVETFEEISPRGRRLPYRRDGYRWYNAMSKRSVRVGVGLQKMSWYLKQVPSPEMLAAGKREVIDERFLKIEYTVDGKRVLIHYMGDERVAVPWTSAEIGLKPGERRPYVQLMDPKLDKRRQRFGKPLPRKGASSLDPKDNDLPLSQLYSDLPAHAARPFRRGAQIINMADALNVLAEPSGLTTTWGELYYPKGGDVFLLDLSMYDLEDNVYSYREDGYKWLMYSKQKKSSCLGEYSKTYWCLKQPAPEGDRAFDPRFKRREIDMGTGFVLIHYLGDETIVDYELMGEGQWTRERGFVKRGYQPIFLPPTMQFPRRRRVIKQQEIESIPMDHQEAEFCSSIPVQYEEIIEPDEIQEEVQGPQLVQVPVDQIEELTQNGVGEWYQDEEGNWYTTVINTEEVIAEHEEEQKPEEEVEYNEEYEQIVQQPSPKIQRVTVQ